MSTFLPLIIVLLLATGAGAQTPGAPPPPSPGGAFYAESSNAIPMRLFGTVRVRGDSVEVSVSEGSLALPWPSSIGWRYRIPSRHAPYTRVRLRAYLSEGAGNERDPGVGGGFVEVVPSISAGEEHRIRPVRFVLPRPARTLDSVGLVFQVYAAAPVEPYSGEKEISYHACAKYGVFALPRAWVESYRTCGALAYREPPATGVAHRGSRPPVRPVCVEDPGSPNFMRPSDIIVERLAADSALSRNGERRPLSEFRPRIVGYVAGPEGLDPPGMDVGDHDPWNGAQLFGTLYARFGLPRPIPPGLLIRIGEALGASVFTPPGGDLLEPPVIYVLLPDCRYQPYQLPHS
jgi:hypothetical protein